MKTLFFILLLNFSLFSSTLNTAPKLSSLIVYNDGIALVHEERELNLNEGDKQIIYEDVAKSIKTDSVNIVLPSSITLFSQQYRYDKLTLLKLLDAHIGKKVLVKNKVFTLLSHNGRNAILKNKDSLISSVLVKDIIFKTIPNSLITKPSLVWNVDTKKSINTTISIDYLINNLSWRGDYILNLHKNTLDLSGWITINNRSGKAYKNIELSVLAGDLNKISHQKPRYKQTKNMLMMSSTPNVNHEAHEGYHLYLIPFKINLANNEKTQIKFITKKSIPMSRKYSVTLSNPLYLYKEKKHSVDQYIKIDGLNFALPKGSVRTYSKFKNKNIFLGETQLFHTPKNTKINLKIGKNFDIKVKESIYKRVDNKHNLDATVIYSIQNSSDKPKTIELLIPFNRHNKSLIDTKRDYSFKYGNKLSFKILVDAQKTEKFKVRFRNKI